MYATFCNTSSLWAIALRRVSISNAPLGCPHAQVPVRKRVLGKVRWRATVTHWCKWCILGLPSSTSSRNGRRLHLSRSSTPTATATAGAHPAATGCTSWLRCAGLTANRTSLFKSRSWEEGSWIDATIRSSIWGVNGRS